MTASPKRVALYARYSTDMQNPNSVRDQFHNCDARAAQEGWHVVERYSDEAESGTNRHRPQYKRLMADLGADRFDVVLVETLDRISRSQVDTAEFFQTARFHGIEIHALDHGKVGAMHVGLAGIMGEAYLTELADRTRRGQAGRVRDGKSAGGLSYGYRVKRGRHGEPATGELEIVEEEAAVIRRIFRDYAAGVSPLKIAAALNEEGLPAPRGRGAGSGHWKQNTINGNRARGTGILNNELYVGKRVWNRIEYRRHPETRRRVAKPRDPSEWEISAVPELRIIDDALWQEVKQRQDRMTKKRSATPATDRNGLSTSQSLRRRHYLLSGLLECGQCGGKLTVAGPGARKRYYCANHKEKGKAVCAGMPGLRQNDAEELVLNGFRQGLMTDAAYLEFRERFARHFNAQQGERIAQAQILDKRIKETERAVENLIAVLERGDYSETIMTRLRDQEARLKNLRAERTECEPAPVELPENLPEIYRRYVEDLVGTLTGEQVLGRAADELERLTERIIVSWDDALSAHRVELVGELSELLAAGHPECADAYRASERSLKLVAGVGFEPTTFRL